jgi:hypothetical protein
MWGTARGPPVSTARPKSIARAPGTRGGIRAGPGLSGAQSAFPGLCKAWEPLGPAGSSYDGFSRDDVMRTRRCAVVSTRARESGENRVPRVPLGHSDRQGCSIAPSTQQQKPVEA